ncbi:toll/interleukin-1 receptor domain-containing protein [Nocardia sp. CA-119907]|uniref:toll/interleukin-1 receptor domain-containing protein n=1 Tax=Nocardia sp. CA-119907 TaxID=3239973 RepID=UPI003D97A7B7
MPESLDGQWDFFVSYTKVDRAWAVWVGGQLEQAGYRVLLQAWDFVPGTHWIAKMDEGVAKSDHTLALLSNAYLQSVYGKVEWTAAFRSDPVGLRRRLIPVRLENCPREGILGGIVSFDLFGLSEAESVAHLLEQVAAIRSGRATPAAAPAFPGSSSLLFPGDVDTGVARGADPGTPVSRADLVPLRTLSGHGSGWVTSAAWSPDGGNLVSGGFDTTIRIWDTITGSMRWAPKDHTRIAGASGGYAAYVRTVAWSPDGRYIASGGDSGTVTIWNVAARRAEHTLKANNALSAAKTLQAWLFNASHGLEVLSVAWSPDGSRLAVGGRDKAVRVWDAATGGLQWTTLGRVGGITSVAWSPDGRTLAVGGAHGVGLHDASTGGHRLTLRGHSGRVESVAWSPDGRFLASAGRDHTVRIWDAQGGESTLVLRGHTAGVESVAWSPDGRHIASAGNDETVRIWSSDSGTMLCSVIAHPAVEWNSDPYAALSVAWCPDRLRLAAGGPRRLASAGADGTVRLWELA